MIAPTATETATMISRIRSAIRQPFPLLFRFSSAIMAIFSFPPKSNLYACGAWSSAFSTAWSQAFEVSVAALWVMTVPIAQWVV
jgi:hypothetical protein